MLLQRAKQNTAKTASIPAPIGGWNARDSLANMQPMDAVQMINFFPTPTDVTMRKGWTEKSTGIVGQVNTVITYSLANGGYKLFAMAGTKIWNCDTSTATIAFDGITDSKFQYINFSNAGGDYIVACNGVDATMVYDGTRWFKLASTSTAQTIGTITHSGTTATLTTLTAHGLATGNLVTVSGASPTEYNGTYVITVTGATTFTYEMASAPATNAITVGTYSVLGITGINSNKFINVNLFKNRIYFTEKDSMNIWYLDVDAIAGPATSFPFGGIAKKGGYLQAMGTWTLDAGQGVDDYAVFVSSMGEIMVYNGTDPTSVTSWALKGVWELGQTFSRRCFTKWAGDLLLLTQDGLVPLASALQSSRLDPRVNITDKIYYAVSQAATQYYANFGWQVIYYASENMLILNIPTNEGMEQYVMHTITKAWARFTGIQAYCFVNSGDNDIHFGGNGFVGTFYNGYSDNGTNITAAVQQAYSYFDNPGQLKRFTMVRPILQSSGGVPNTLCGISVDFEPVDNLGAISFNPNINAYGIWDTGVWDTSLWAGGLITTKVWQGVTGIGYAGSVNLTAVSQGIELHWASTDYVMEAGGIV